jgi:glyoxylase-like metal-dependent hydrolase (beta-lactamase superfamily II)
MTSLRRLTWFDHVNVYLLATPRGPVLVDSAAPGMFGWLVRALRRVDLAPQDLAAVVVTHFHIDHVGTAARLRRLGVPMYALCEEVPILTGSAPHPGYGGLAGRALLAAERAVFGDPRFADVRALRDGELLFDTSWRVLAAPGHTPGSLALFDEMSGDLLSGDTLVSDFAWPRGPHPLFTADYPRAAASALDLLARGPERIHPGHGKPLPAAAYDSVRDRLRRKLDRIGAGPTAPRSPSPAAVPDPRSPPRARSCFPRT